MTIQSDSHRTQLQNQQLCHENLNKILLEAENDCKPEKEPSKEQVERVMQLEKAFKHEKRTEKQKIKEKKSSRALKNNWKNI